VVIGTISRGINAMNINRRDFFKLTAATTAFAALPKVMPARAQDDGDAEVLPNIIFVLLDDLPLRTVGSFNSNFQNGAMVYEGGDRIPILRNFIGEPGGSVVNFTRNISNHPICGPSRATCLTGLRSPNHGVVKNPMVGQMAQLENNTVGKWLQDKGYVTGLRGKRSFGKKDKYIPRPAGWDWWEPGGGNGDTVFPAAAQWIKNVRSDKPVFLCAWPTEPHTKYYIKPQYKEADILLPPPSESCFNNDVSGPMSPRSLSNQATNEKQIARSMLGVDDGIKLLINALKETGRWDNTVLIVMSDNGYQLGEQGLINQKDLPYKASAMVPLLIRDQRKTLERRDINTIVSNVDIAPTIASLAGVVTPYRTDGQSLVPQLNYDWQGWSERAIVEKPEPTTKNGITYRGIYGVVNGVRWMYVKFSNGKEQLYNIDDDPEQTTNLMGTSTSTVVTPMLRDMIQQMVSQKVGP